jgi:hypothetical protein
MNNKLNNNVQFITLNAEGEEVYGALVINGERQDSGFWRTNDKVEASKRALELAGLDPNTEIRID